MLEIRNELGLIKISVQIEETNILIMDKMTDQSNQKRVRHIT